MKLCVVGNSHAAALKGALAAHDSAAGVSVDFFVMPGGAGPHLYTESATACFPIRSKKDKVVLHHPRRIVDGLDLASFDAVMICAAGLSFPSQRRSQTTSSSRLALGAMVHAPERRIVQTRLRGCPWQAPWKGLCNASPNFASIRLIRSVFSGPITIQVCPCQPARSPPTRASEGEKGSNLAMLYGDRVWPFLSWYYRRQVNLISAFADSLGSASVIPPEESFLDAGFTPQQVRHARPMAYEHGLRTPHIEACAGRDFAPTSSA